jgi:hypothetical protein
MMKRIRCGNLRAHLLLAGVLIAVGAVPARAQQGADFNKLIVKPIVDARVRYEAVDQPTLEAEAVTLRLRMGAEATLGGFSILAESEANVAPVSGYNAFPFPAVGERQWRPAYAAVSDPENLEINRLQLQHRSGAGTFTLGRQRINLDDQRWVGSVGWRQNEQTFDAVRGETQVGAVAIDLTYANSQRTIFGGDAGPRAAYGGDFLFAGLSSRQGPLQARLFAYLLNYDEAFFVANSSRTYGGTLSTTMPLGTARLALRGSYARQTDFGNNPFNYAADYWAVEAGMTLAGFTIGTGWEQLGSENGRAVQTPMATLHKFNGWADMFLSTPPHGLRDFYVSLSRRFEGVRQLPGLNAHLAYHRFDSAVGGVRYGSEWNASVGFKLGPTALLLKYADYDAQGFGMDTRKLWLQLEWALP